MGRSRRWANALAVVTVCAATLVGCVSIPADVDGTLDRVRDGVLRVGVTHSPPWTDTSGDGPTGTEIELARGLAEELDAEVEWTIDSEAQLVESIHRGGLDLIIGGITGDTPWTDKAATTATYTEAPDDTGAMKKHVMLVRPGENAFLVQVEDFLAREGGAS